MSRKLAPVTPELVWFSGADAVRFLDDLLSQEIADVAPGVVARTLLLTPQGKIDFILWALRGSDRVGLITEDGRGDELVSRLSRYRIRVDVDIERDRRRVALVIGGDTNPHRQWWEDGERLSADLSWPGQVRVLLAGEVPDLPMMTEEAYTSARIAVGEPLAGIDVTDTTIPQETGLVPDSISFTKGCFLGQELVARLDSRGGRVNHHLRILRFDDPAPPAGSVAESDGNTVGVVTSSAGRVGLALLERGVEPGDRVTVAGGRATVEAVPGAG